MLVALRHHGQDFFNIFLKAHVQHLIRFIQNYHIGIIQLQCTAVQMIHDTARCTDNDTAASFQQLNLTVNRLTSVNRNDLNAFLVL